LAEFRRTLAIAPGTGIVNLAGNALSGMGVALLDLGRVDEAIPFLQAALSIRTELDDLEQQHIDLTPISRLPPCAVVGGRFQPRSLDSSRVVVAPPATAYRHDRRRSDAVCWKP
jgi:hypothetical protein